MISLKKPINFALVNNVVRWFGSRSTQCWPMIPAGSRMMLGDQQLEAILGDTLKIHFLKITNDFICKDISNLNYLSLAPLFQVRLI